MTILSLLTRIDRSNRYKFVGILDQKMIAFCELDLDQPQVYVATIYSVYVDPAYRHRGYAQRLLQTALRAAQAHGKEVVNLQVHQGNIGAVSLYKRLGFEQYAGPDEAGLVDLMVVA